MKENKNLKASVLVTESSQKDTLSAPNDTSTSNMERLKKPLIFSLLGIVFLGCMYLIFAPSSSEKAKMENIGLNEDVPQATDKGLQSDKRKAYEEENLQQKDQQKKSALSSLSDYWNSEGNATIPSEALVEEEETTNSTRSSVQTKANPALNSYRTIQNTLGGFYEENNSESSNLRKELEDLKKERERKESTVTNPMESQLALMEKSYEMAAKYFPTTKQDELSAKIQTTIPLDSSQKEIFVPFSSVPKGAVSSLYREPTDSTFLASWGENRNAGFNTVGKTNTDIQPKNSIRACVQETVTVTAESVVRLRLLEATRLLNHTAPKGTVVTAITKFQGGRLQLKVISVELEGNIIPTDITAYDLDGQQGVHIPYSPERNALTETVAGMGTTTGTNLTLTSSAGQQLAADLSKGLIQGVSGYFSKKVRTPKVTLKAGYQLLLISTK